MRNINVLLVNDHGKVPMAFVYEPGTDIMDSFYGYLRSARCQSESRETLTWRDLPAIISRAADEECYLSRFGVIYFTDSHKDLGWFSGKCIQHVGKVDIDDLIFPASYRSGWVIIDNGEDSPVMALPITVKCSLNNEMATIRDVAERHGIKTWAQLYGRSDTDYGEELYVGFPHYFADSVEGAIFGCIHGNEPISGSR